MVSFIGQEVWQYRITEMIEKTDLGITYLASHKETEKKAIVKLLSATINAKSDFLERLGRALIDFRRITHPNILAPIDLRLTEHGWILVLEFADAVPLTVRIDEAEAIPLKELPDIFSQILRGLKSAHEGGIVHSGLTPHNVMITASGQVKLSAFELGQTRDFDGKYQYLRTDVQTAPETTAYIAPEQVGRIIQDDPRSDLYSVGLILYKAMLGKKAFIDDYTETEPAEEDAIWLSPQTH